jgi:tRNA (guanine37-N1)-methyltransferase
MKIDILTLFPEMFSALDESILKKAKEKGILDIDLVNIRDFSLDSNKRCDDYCYGGGSGMLMTPQPLYDSIKSVLKNDTTLIYMSPKGKKLDDKLAFELSQKQHIAIICGHYEGIDERIIDIFRPMEISIGDYVLTGGELPAMVLVDCVSRKIQGVLGNQHSEEDESFKNNLLEYPQYTRPADFMGHKVPEILLSGNHQKVDEYRKELSKKITKERRADLLGEGNEN